MTKKSKKEPFLHIKMKKIELKKEIEKIKTEKLIY